MSALGSLVVKLALEHAEYTQGLDKSSQEALKFAKNAQRSFDEASASVKGFMKGAVGQAAAAVGALVAVNESFTRSLEFSKSIAQISTQIDGSIDDLNRLEAAAKAMSAQFGTLPVEQSRAFYEIISSGTSDVTKATELLSAANKLAIGGMTDLATSVDGLTNIMNSYSGKVESVDAVSDALFVGMRAGKANMEELSSSLGKVTPIAASMNVSFDELVATVAALSLQGISTKESITGVRAILASVAKPTKEAKDLAGSLGLEFGAAGLQAKGFAGFLDEVSKKTGGNVDKLALLFGGVEALIPIMALSGQAGKDFSQIMLDMGNKAGTTQDAFEKMAASPGFKIDQLMASISNIAITLGDALANVLAPAAAKASNALNELFGIKDLSEIDKQKQKLTELQSELDSMNNRKHLPFFLDTFFFDKKQADLLEQMIEDGIVDLQKLEAAASDAGKAIGSSGGVAATIDNEFAPSVDKMTKVTKQQVSEGDRFLDILNKEAAQLGKTSVEIRKMEAAKLGLSSVADPLIDRIEKETAAARKLEAQLSRVKSITESVQTADERFTQTVDELNDLMALPNSGLSVETYSRAVKKAQSELDQSMNATVDAGRQAANQWNDIWRNAENTARNSFVQFAAHGKSAMQSIGESIKLFIFDALYQLTVRKWIINVGAAVGIGGTGSALAADGGGSILSAASLGSNALSLFKSGFGATGLISKVGSMLPGSAGSFFSGMGVTGTQAAAEAGASALWGASGASAAASMGSSFAAVAGPAIALAAVDAIGRLLAGDKKLGGAEMIPVVGGFLAALFGRGPYKFRQQSIQGTASSAGFDGDITNVFRAKGGLFRSNGHKSQTEQFTLEQQTLFDSVLNGFYGSAHQFAENLGLSTDLVDNFTQEVQIKSEKGKTVTEEAINAMLQGIGNSLAQNVLPIVDTLRKAGEDSFATLTRLNNEFVTLTQGAQNLGASADYARELISAMSFDSRTAFIELAGGADNLNVLTSSFSKNFLNDAERLAPIQEQLKKGLTDLGFAADLTNEQYKALVQSIDLSDEARIKLLELGDALFVVNSAADAAANTIKENANIALNSAFAALQRSVDAERKSITERYNAALEAVNKRIQSVTDSIGKLKNLSDALKSTISTLRPLSRDDAKFQILSAINQAKRGIFPEAKDIQEALGVLSQKSTAGFSSGFEFAREQAKTANLVGELGDLTDSQLSVEERSLKQLQDQQRTLQDGFQNEMDRLDELLAQAQNQINSINKLDTSIVALTDAIKNFNLASSQGGGGVIGDGATSGNPDISNQQIIDFFSVPRSAMEIYKAHLETGVSSQQIINTGRYTQADADKFFRDNPDIPPFANGGFHRGGLRIVGERGPELERTGPSHITSNNDLKKSIGNDRVVQELIKMNKILEAVTQGGTAIRTKTGT